MCADCNTSTETAAVTMFEARCGIESVRHITEQNRPDMTTAKLFDTLSMVMTGLQCRPALQYCHCNYSIHLNETHCCMMYQAVLISIWITNLAKDAMSCTLCLTC